MRPSLAQILAEIRLNYSNVEQFLTIACGLGDDNPTIRSGIYEAAEEVRSATILIDHLRSLFGHQQAIEQQQPPPPSQDLQFHHHDQLNRLVGLQANATLEAQQRQQNNLAHQRNLQIFTYSNQTTLIKAAKCLVANVAKILYLTESIVSQATPFVGGDNDENDRPRVDYENRDDAANEQTRELDRAQQQIHNNNRYATTNRASKQQQRDNRIGLDFAPPNVSPLCQLSDNILLAKQFEQPARHYLEAKKLHHGTGGLLMSGGDRLDNVANYSQLLRSFSELSGQLVDLGQCLMLARNLKRLSNHRNHNNSASDNNHWSATSGNVAVCSGAAATTTGQLQQHQLVRSRSFANSEQQQQQLLFNCSLPPEQQQQQRQQFEQFNNNNNNVQRTTTGNNNTFNPQLDPFCNDRGAAQEEQQFGAGCCARPSSSSSYCPMQRASAQQLQQPYSAMMMPTMFETNTDSSGQRQLYDPSASSCTMISLDDRKRKSPPSSSQLNCPIVTQINDMQTLFQVNRLIMDRSILLLLSASKCCLRENVVLVGAEPMQQQQHLHGLEARRSISAQIRVSMSIIMAVVKCSVFQDDVDGDDNDAARGSSSAFMAAHQNGDDGDSINSSSFQHRSGHFSCGAPRTTKVTSNNENATNSIDCSRRSIIQGSDEHQPQKQHEQQLSSLFASFDQTKFGPKKTTTTTSNSGSSNEIINYFLQTFNGITSAHDSIVRLQNLIEPFAHVSSQNELCIELDEALLRNRRTQQDCTTKVRSSKVPATTHNGERQQRDMVNSDNHHQRRPIELNGFGGDDCQDGDEELMANNKENNNGCRTSTSTTSQQQRRHHTATTTILDTELTPVLLMDKRQLVRALNLIFLGDSRSQLIERLHEFTDCAYTRHEQRESIVLLLACIKLQLNKFVRLIYRLRRRTAASNEPDQFNQLRQLACHLVDTCAELNYELQTVVIEQSDELDRSNNQLDLVKQLKHHCSMGDIPKTQLCCNQLHDQSEQLVEVCRMLNQVAPTNKLKIMTKTLAIWFELNVSQLLQAGQCLSENPRSRVTKDFVWGFSQVWCSFYDDFCQLARQVAYLAHSQFDSLRSARVASIKEQVLARQQQQASGADLTTAATRAVAGQSAAPPSLDNQLMMMTRSSPTNNNNNNNSSSSNSSLLLMAVAAPNLAGSSSAATSTVVAQSALPDMNSIDQQQQRNIFSHSSGNRFGREQIPGRNSHAAASWRSIGSVQSLNSPASFIVYGGGGSGLSGLPASQQLQPGQQRQQHEAAMFDCGGGGEPLTDSPRSLDHYYGFGANYHRRLQEQRACCYLLDDDDDDRGAARDHHQLPFERRRIDQVVDESATLIGNFEADCRRQRRQRLFVQQQQDHDGGEQQLMMVNSFAGAWRSGSETSPPPLNSVVAPSHLRRHFSPALVNNNLSEQQQQHFVQPALHSQQQQQNYYHHQRHHQLPSHLTHTIETSSLEDEDDFIHPPAVPRRSTTTTTSTTTTSRHHQQQQQQFAIVDQHHSQQQQQFAATTARPPPPSAADRQAAINQHRSSRLTMSTTTRTAAAQQQQQQQQQLNELTEESEVETTTLAATNSAPAVNNSSSSTTTIALDQQSVVSSSTLEGGGQAASSVDKWSDSEADAIVRGARETAQMALSMYQFTRGEGDLNTTQDLFTQAELFAEEANELYKEVRCFSYKVPAGDLKKQLLNQLSAIPALVQQLQFIVKNPTVGKAATFAKVDSVIRETRNLMEAVNRVVDATLSCRQHYNMAIGSMRKRTRTLSPSYRADKGFEFDSASSLAGGGGRHQSAFGGRSAGGPMGSEPDI